MKEIVIAGIALAALYFADRNVKSPQSSPAGIQPNSNSLFPSVGTMLNNYRVISIGSGSPVEFQGAQLPIGSMVRNMLDNKEYSVTALGISPKAQTELLAGAMKIRAAAGFESLFDIDIPRYTHEQLEAARVGGYYLL